MEILKQLSNIYPIAKRPEAEFETDIFGWKLITLTNKVTHHISTFIGSDNWNKHWLEQTLKFRTFYGIAIYWIFSPHPTQRLLRFQCDLLCKSLLQFSPIVRRLFALSLLISWPAAVLRKAISFHCCFWLFWSCFWLFLDLSRWKKLPKEIIWHRQTETIPTKFQLISATLLNWT